MCVCVRLEFDDAMMYTQCVWICVGERLKGCVIIYELKLIWGVIFSALILKFFFCIYFFAPLPIGWWYSNFIIAQLVLIW